MSPALQLADWHEGRSAARMLVAALGAYFVTNVIHLPGPYSAVITTLVVARPHSGGVLRASFERLAATLLGAGLACAATFGRLLHLPELMLIGLVLTPLALVAAHNSAYRTAMIAAMIVLSAPAAVGTPLYIAGARMAGVSLGAIVGALVSITILPSRREVVVASAVAKLLEQLPGYLCNACQLSSDDEASRDRFEFRIRQSLRDLGMLIRDRPDAPAHKGPAAAIVKFTVQMHADITFLKRELAGKQPLPTAELTAFAAAYAAATRQVAWSARGQSTTFDIQPLRSACSAAAHSLADSDGARLMFRRLLEDLVGLSRSLERASRSP